MRPRFVLTLCSALLPPSCDILDPGEDCTTDERFGLVVYAVNETGAPVTEGLVIVARDEDYVEQLTGDHNVRYGAPERSGTYDLTVEAIGFETRTVENVRVRQGDCHIVAAAVTVELSPLG